VSQVGRVAAHLFVFIKFPSYPLPKDDIEPAALQQSLQSFCQTLPHFELLSNTPADVLRQQLVTFTMSQVALIRACTRSSNPTLQKVAVQAAHNVFEATRKTQQNHQWKYIDPIMGVSTCVYITQ
jgi:uncharacterized protein YchJ